MDKIDLGRGIVTYNNFNIDFNRSFAEQEDELLEDLLQVEYENGYLLDLGWYPEFDAMGNFVLNVIRNDDWNNPICSIAFAKENELKEALEKGLTAIRSTNNI